MKIHVRDLLGNYVFKIGLKNKKNDFEKTNQNKHEISFQLKPTASMAFKN